MTRAVGPATGRVTTCHGDHGRHGAGHVQRKVTVPGHAGHGAGPPLVTAFTAPVTATSVTESGQRRRRSRGFLTRAGGWDKSRASPH
jgi:hypothetical protein